MRNFASLDRFLSSLSNDIYPETPSEPHITITRTTIQALLAQGVLSVGMRILDIGCGQGLALEQFRDAGLTAVGVTLGADVNVCRAKGLDIREADQNFMDFDDGSFDFLWCRHVLEHSVAPLFTLSEYRRIVKPDGHVYIEVPAPDTTAHHETNINHYSVLPHSSWMNLMVRAGFSVQQSVQINVSVPCGADYYWSFLLRPTNVPA